MSEAILASIIGTLIGGIITIVVGISIKRQWFTWIKRGFIKALTKQNITNVLPYEMALKNMQNLISSNTSSTGELNVLNFMVFMGQDITFPEERLMNRIEEFLKRGGTLNILIINPKSIHIKERAKRLNMKEDDLRQKINTSIININHSFKKNYPSKVTVKLYDEMPLFRLNFIRDTLFMGFYEDVSSYNNYFYEIPNSSVCYSIMKSFFNKTFETAQEV